jgi:hypothetical protein
MAEFLTPIDVCNRAMQHLGAKRIDPVRGFTEQSVQASECSFAYGKLRRAELRRNLWSFAIKRTVLRPVNALAIQGMAFQTTNSGAVSPTMFLSPALWSSVTTYSGGALVTTIDGTIWQALAPATAAYAPGNSVAWDEYSGPLTVDAWTPQTSYFAGDLVYIAPGDGTYVVYQSLIGGNTDAPAAASLYAAAQVYARDEIVIFNSIVYQSLVDLNYGHQPDTSAAQWSTVITSGSSATSWRVIAAELKQMVIMYPLGSGPSVQTASRNAFRLPANYLREAPQDPKAGAISYLGMMGNLAFNDWTYDGAYITSMYAQPIPYRFVADLTNVSTFDDMFCEALAARIAYETCETITQSTAKQESCAKAYQKFMGEAGMVNAIEQGWVEPPLDDLIACRF